MYEQYKEKLKITLNYVIKNPEAEINDYGYAMALLFQSIYFISENLIDTVKEIFADFSIPELSFDEELKIVHHFDNSHKISYLYVFNLIKNDIENYNKISDDTKMVMLIMLNRLSHSSNFFVSLEEAEEYNYQYELKYLQDRGVKND